MLNQYQRIARLLTRTSGATAMDISTVAGTVSAHSRLSEMKRKGWTITRRPLPGKSYGTYHGQPPGESFAEMGDRARKAAA